jgi:histone-lysine N-methyltransferase SETMAR
MKKFVRKRGGLQKKKSPFIMTMHQSTKVFWHLHYELLEHPPYSPDLAPSDFHLFPKLKLCLAGQCFSSNQEAIAAVKGYFADLMENYYRVGIMTLEHRWNKCISLKGDWTQIFCGSVAYQGRGRFEG